jgi:hypothetical protein
MIRITSSTFSEAVGRYMYSDAVDYWPELSPSNGNPHYRDTLTALAEFHRVVNSLGSNQDATYSD